MTDFSDEFRVVVAEERLVYVFASEADVERWSLHDVPTYRRVETATDEEVLNAVQAVDELPTDNLG